MSNAIVCSKAQRRCLETIGKDGPSCGVLYEEKQLFCSRFKTHPGPHIACGGGDEDEDHNMAIWEE